MPGVDDEVGALPLLAVRHLAGEERFEFFDVMPGRAMTRARCTAGSAVTTTTASTRARTARLEEQRDVDQHQRPARGFMAIEERGLLLPHQRMDDRFEPGQRVGIADAPPRQAVERSTLPSAATPGNAASTAATAGPA